MASIVAQTKIDLISKALILCGEKPITSLSDNRYGATVGSNMFELLYENELQSNLWRFAMTKGALSQLVAQPLNKWRYAYQLPTDMLLPVGIYPVDLQYEIYADHLYTDRSSVELDYMFKPEVTAVPAYFSTLMVFTLAQHFIKPITESDSAVEVMRRKYEMQRNVALWSDAQGRPAKPVVHSPFTDVR